MARYAAPVAFLVAVTIGLLLVRAALDDDEPVAGAPATSQTAAAGTTSPSRSGSTPTSGEPRRVYRIRTGDTLGSIAARFDTSVERIVELNPGIDPTGLQVGQRIRVK